MTTSLMSRCTRCKRQALQTSRYPMTKNILTLTRTHTRACTAQAQEARSSSPCAMSCPIPSGEYVPLKPVSTIHTWRYHTTTHLTDYPYPSPQGPPPSRQKTARSPPHLPPFLPARPVPIPIPTTLHPPPLLPLRAGRLARIRAPHDERRAARRRRRGRCRHDGPGGRGPDVGVLFG